MKHALAPVAALLISTAILMTGSGVQTILLPVRAALEQFSTVAIGLMGAGYFLGFTVGCLKGGELVKKVGHVRVFLAMTALGSAVPLLQGLLVDPLAWVLLRFLTGLCFAVIFLVIESWLNEQASNENRGIVFSTYVMITLTLLAVGQMMTLVYPAEGLELFLIASVLVSVAAIPVALSTSATPAQPLDSEVALGRLFTISPAGVLGCLTTGATNGAFWSLAPVFAASGGDTALAAWFMTATVIGGAIAQWPLGFASDRLGRRKTLSGAAILGTLVAASLVLAGPDTGFVLLCMLGAAWGFCSFPMYAISVAHANDLAEPEEYVMVSSGLLLVYGAGAVVGPFLASGIMTFAGVSGLYITTGLVHIALAGYLLLRIVRRTHVPSEHQISFGDALATAHTASQVYEEEYLHHVEEDNLQEAKTAGT